MIILIWFIFAIACSLIAEKKGYNQIIWFLLGVLFGIFSLGVIIFLPDKN